MPLKRLLFICTAVLGTCFFLWCSLSAPENETVLSSITPSIPALTVEEVDDLPKPPLTAKPTTSTDEKKPSNDDKKEKESGNEQFKVATSFFVCIVCIILATVLFELLKDGILEMVEGTSLQSMVDAMFGELTVLGFIGLVAFVMNEAGVLKSISKAVFQENADDAEAAAENAKRVPEMVETVHFQVFVIMVVFIAEVVLLIFLGKALERKWHSAENIVQDETAAGDIPDLLRKMDELEASASSQDSCYGSCFAEEPEYDIDYLALRAEFISPRATAAGYATLDENFDFAQYLSSVLGLCLAQVVSISTSVWVCLLLAVSTCFCLLLAFSIDLRYLTISVALIAWTTAGVGYALGRRLCWARQQLVSWEKLRVQLRDREVALLKSTLDKKEETEPHAEGDKADAETDTGCGKADAEPADSVAVTLPTEGAAASSDVAQETTPLKRACRSPGSNTGLHPRYEDHEATVNRSWCGRYWLGDLPNKHEQLFWFDTKGAQFSEIFIQLVLVSMAIYVSILTVTFRFFTEDLQEGKIGAFAFAFVVLLLFTPPIVNFCMIVRLLGDHVVVTNVEKMIDPKTVLRAKATQRTAKVIRILSIINDLRKKASIVAAAREVRAPQSSGDDTTALVAAMDYRRRQEINAIFNYFDRDGSGTLDVEELHRFLNTLGLSADDETAQNLMAALDDDSNGTIDAAEFIAWMAASEQRAGGTEETLEEAAHQMFGMFDTDGDGSLTLAEFQTKMSDFGTRMSPDELSMLMRELDADGTGHIEASDFLSLLERHDFEP